MLNTILELSRLVGISGREDAVRQYLLAQIEGHADYTVDALGNLLVYKKGRQAAKRKVMLAAHMDEVGMLVNYITEEGLLKFTTVGGIDAAVLLGKAVCVGQVNGVIGVRPVHFLQGEEKKKLPEIDSLYIDIGAASKAEAEALVQVGDSVCFLSQPVQFGAGFLKGPALDDRIGCAILLELIKQDLPFDLQFAFTVQEEVGLRGATTAAAQMQPDYALVVETTTAADLADITGEKQVCQVGQGAVLSFMDRATLYPMELYRHALQTAAEAGIPVQSKTQVAGGNDAGAIHMSGTGVKTLAVSVPCRYLHSPACVVQTADIDSVYRLVTSLAEAYANAAID